MTMSERARIVVLTCRNPVNYALIDALATTHDIVGIVFENQLKLRGRIFLRRIRKLGIFTVADQLLFKVPDVLFFQRRAASKANRILNHDGSFDPRLLPKERIVDTTSVNSPVASDLIRETKPSVIVVSGTSLIGESMLGAAKDVPIVNIHCGITPRYRGAHGAFWAIVNRDWENVGTTIHLVDKSIDTGAIVSQGRIDPQPTDNPRDLALRQYAVGIKLLMDAMPGLSSRTFATFAREDLDSRFYSSPTLSAYFKYRKSMRERFGARDKDGRFL